MKALSLLVTALLALSAPRAYGASPASNAPRAPSGPPLSIPVLPGVIGSGSAGHPSATPPSRGDVLAGNGLDSPFCREPSDLPASAEVNCRTARFSAGPYPTGNYMFDVNIDTGVVSWSNDASAVVQNIAQLGWMLLVSLAHGLVVMLEWCYSLGLAGGALMGEASSRLRGAGLGFTEPLLALALAVAGALAAYQGLVRRRATETVGRVLVTLAMMAGGLWLIVNPAGTVGALQRWSDEAGAGTLALAASGVSGEPRRTLTDGLGKVFGAVVTAPWCYLEFGSVDWCDSPKRLDPRLQAAASRIAARLQRRSPCVSFCSGAERAASDSSGSSVQLLRQAQTNGELFLALPAEQALRNSTNTKESLLSVLCGGGTSAEHCNGPTAAQAEFRGASGTYGRVIGLLLIWLGALGVLLLFGFFAIRLLLCGVATVGYLLLAPAAVLVPVFGESGRDAFRTWAMRLMTAAVSKLAYSFLLGVALTVTSLILHMTQLGWWAQWLLLSAFWWTAFLKRHQALAALPRPQRQVIVHVQRQGAPRPGRAARRLIGRAS